jgi:predicted nucleotidyltransferase
VIGGRLRRLPCRGNLEDALGARVDLVTTSGFKPRARPGIERQAIDVA